MLYNPTGNPADVTVESFDISTAFLQGLDYKALQKYARDLGYEYRENRDVYIEPPENVWEHFRKCQMHQRVGNNQTVCEHALFYAVFVLCMALQMHHLCINLHW